MLVPVVLVDVFTKEVGKGNRAGVVLDASHLTEAQMQHVAKIVNVSETAFVLPGKDKKYDLEIRFFTPTQEVPICGHGTIATHYLLVHQSQQKQRHFLTKTGIGILSVDTQEDHDGVKVAMTQGPAVFEPIMIELFQNRLLQALGLSLTDLIDGLPIQIVSTGHSKVMVPLKEKAQLNALTPDFVALERLSHDINCNGYFVFTLDQNPKADILLYGRMFAPSIGIKEDPATGNAHGPAGAYLAHYGIVKPVDNLVHYVATQGEVLGKKGIIEVFIHMHDHEIMKVQIAGTAVIANEMQVKLI